MLFRIFGGLILAAMGFMVVWKTHAIVDFFGSSAWAESKLGPSGTYMLYKAVGIIIIFAGFLMATGLWGSFLQATLGSLFLPNRTPL